MKILIIGSQGFIGWHLYEYFSRIGEVYGADVINRQPQKHFVLLDQEKPSFNEILKQYKFDVCINASGNGSVPVSLEKPLHDFNLNVMNTIKVLDALRLYNPGCRYVNISSAAVYGNPRQLPIKEGDPSMPLSPYGWHKHYSEQICNEYKMLHGIKSVSLRLFSVYGEGLRKQLFWDIYQKTQQSKSIELFGTGNETRDFIYIEDLVRAVQCVVEKAEFEAQVINVASGVETSIREAALVFCREIDPAIEVSFNNKSKPGDPLQWRADISVLSEMGFSVRTSIHEGLKNTTKWLKENV